MKTGAELLLDYYGRRVQAGEMTKETLERMVDAGQISEEEKTFILTYGNGEEKDLQEFYDAVTKEVGL